MNDIAAVDFQTTVPLYFDSYRENRQMGGFIIIDPITNATVGAGTIERAIESARGTRPAGSPADRGRSTKQERILRFGHPPAAVWLRGRSHVAEILERKLFDEGWHVQLVGQMDFLPHELITVGRRFVLRGILPCSLRSMTGQTNGRRCARFSGRTHFSCSTGTIRTTKRPRQKSWKRCENGATRIRTRGEEKNEPR